ncbi:MAG: tRNA lysidine(34) synthetase TilS [Planctomycetaceae bacterium]|nr:tRNA lysidine(34) synthetase TilS [Planctomycetaceae bacterium]
MTATIRPPLVQTLRSAWPPEKWNDLTVLVAVSGGADSVALARAMLDIRGAGEGRLVLAHYNHKLRGAESDADQAFVEQLGAGLGLEVVAGVRAEEGAKASEESLRSSRYEFLAQAAGQCGARYVVTAHTADDQVETVLTNILRGTGLAGLAGIPRARQLTAAATLVRPLLDVSRAEVLNYLQEVNQPFRQDSSNSSTDYTRNRIRHELLPLLERDFNPQVRQAITRLSRLAGEADDEISGLATDLAAMHARRITDGVEIPLATLAPLSDYMARSVLRAAWRWQGWPEQEMGLDEWDALVAITRDAQIAPQMFPGSIRAQRAGDLLRLTRL